MGKCNICKRKKIILMQCKFCNNDMCTYCLLPETHNCTDITSCIQQSKEILSNDLINNKVIKEKIVKC